LPSVGLRPSWPIEILSCLTDGFPSYRLVARSKRRFTHGYETSHHLASAIIVPRTLFRPLYATLVPRDIRKSELGFDFAARDRGSFAVLVATRIGEDALSFYRVAASRIKRSD